MHNLNFQTFSITFQALLYDFELKKKKKNVYHTKNMKSLTFSKRNRLGKIKKEDGDV